MTPVLLPTLWLLNRRHDPGSGTLPGPIVPGWTRTIVAAAGAVLLLGVSIERRWKALQLLIDSAALGLALVGIGVVREYGDLTVSRTGRVAFLVILAAFVLGLLAVRLASAVSGLGTHVVEMGRRVGRHSVPRSACGAREGVHCWYRSQAAGGSATTTGMSRSVLP